MKQNDSQSLKSRTLIICQNTPPLMDNGTTGCISQRVRSKTKSALQLTELSLGTGTQQEKPKMQMQSHTVSKKIVRLQSTAKTPFEM